MSEVSQLLQAIERGDSVAADQLLPLVYEELRRLAARQLANEGPGQTLQPTALVHEAYLSLVGEGDSPRWAGRAAFVSAASQAMRHILIDAARRKRSLKRGGGMAREPLDPDRVAEPEVADDLLALHEALTALAAAQPAMAKLVELRYFGGLTHEEAAEAIGVSTRTAYSYWAYARAWLLEEVNRGNG